jgi:RalA-binding protein 1
LTKDLITKTSAVPIPISQLAHDPSNAKFFQTAPLPDNASASSPIKAQYGPSPVEVRSGAVSDDGQLSSSLPTSSSLDAAPGLVSLGQRANSELGYYPDLVDQRGSLAPEQQPQQRIRERSAVRQSFHPSLSTVMSSPTERSPSPEPSSTTVSLLSTQSPASSGRGQVKISGPMGGQPIPAGILFGAKDHGQDHVQPGNDRERKAKSRTFWGFGRQPGEHFCFCYS